MDFPTYHGFDEWQFSCHQFLKAKRYKLLHCAITFRGRIPYPSPRTQKTPLRFRRFDDTFQKLYQEVPPFTVYRK